MQSFLASIGIEMRAGAVDVPTLFPGSLIEHGTLVVDETKLLAPGDALNEAAHIALAPPDRRNKEVAFLHEATGGEELTTIAWSWAALLMIDIKPEDVFHGSAYKMIEPETIIDAARRGACIGFPLLQVWEMAFDPANARVRGVEPFPHMVRWLRS